MFVCDLFFNGENNYFADDVTRYLLVSFRKSILSYQKIVFWFASNQMIARDNKCHLILNSSEEDAAIQTEELRTKCSKIKKLLGIHYDYKLKFDTHVDTICRKACGKLTELSRITNYIELPKRRILMNALYKIQFNNYPIHLDAL